MRFMSMVRGRETGTPPTQALMDAIGKLAEKYMRAGKIVTMGGLAPTAMGKRVRASGGTLAVQDGPFTEVKEVIGGYAIFEASSQEEVVQLAREFLQVHIDVLGPSYEGECEIRQLFD